MFLLCAILIWGGVRSYELQLEIEEKERTLLELEETLGEERRALAQEMSESAIRQRANELGLIPWDENDVIIVHVRGNPAQGFLE